MSKTILNSLIVFMAFSGFGSTWYVDDSATGSNSGTSRANAWSNFTSIAWGSITAGDTVKIAAGTYPASLNIGASGTTGNPITVMVDDDPSYNGLVILDGGQIAFGTRNNVVVDGSLSASYARMTNFGGLTVSGWESYLRTNQGIIIRNVQSPNSSSGVSGIAIPIPNTNLVIRWVCVTNVMRAAGFTGSGVEGGQAAHGIQIKDGSIDNILFEYVSVIDAEDDGIASVENTQRNVFDECTFRYGLVKNQGDDPFEVNHGWTVHHSVIGPGKRWHGHGDGLQTVGGHFRIFNNIIFDQHNAPLRMQANQGEDALTQSIYVFGNLFYCRNYNSVGAESVSFLTYGNFPGVQVFTNLYWSNIFFLNNTFARLSDPATTLTMSGRTNYLNITLQSVRAQNNVFWSDTNKTINTDAITIATTANANPIWHASSSDVIVEDNVVSGYARHIGYLGTGYVDAVSFNAATPYDRNSTNIPTFSASASDDYRLAASDTIARNTGTNLSSLGLSGLAFDMNGIQRGADGTWDRGAFEYSSGNLLLHLSFEDDFSDGVVTDSSGRGNHGYRFGRTNNPSGTNWPSRVLTSTTPGRTNSGYAAQFNWYEDGHGFYGRSGDYIAVTNAAPFKNLTNASIMCWYRFYAPHAGQDYTSDANAAAITAGTATGDVGSWWFGRYNQNITLNAFRFVVNTNGSFGQARLDFWDNGFNGNTTNWHHAAITFANGTVIRYWDGVAMATNTLPISYLTVGDDGTRHYDWLGIGCNTHVGTPPLDDGETGGPYPNNGWMNGVIDEVRIYNAAISATEIASIYSDEKGATSGGGGGGGGSTTTGVVNATVFNVQRIQ